MLIESLKMLFLQFLAILMVATIGQVSGEETPPIPLLADVGSTVLSPLKTHCQKHEENKKINRILCESLFALNKKSFDFGKMIMDQMTGTKVKSDLIPHYHNFVAEVGKQIVVTMTGSLHEQIAEIWIWDDISFFDAKLDKEIEKTFKNANAKEESDKLKSLKKLFITKVITLKMDGMQDFIRSTYGIQYVAKKIYEKRVYDDADKQLAFLLDLFVANVSYIESNFHMNLHFSDWQMRMKIEP